MSAQGGAARTQAARDNGRQQPGKAPEKEAFKPQEDQSATKPALQPDGTPSRVRELPTGHDCMVTMPAELSELLLDVAG